MSDMNKLENRVALVAGGASGIGRAIALEFAREGAMVCVADIRKDPLEGGDPTYEAIRLIGGKAEHAVADVSDEGAVVNAVKKTVESFGSLDIVVNSAGIPMKKPTVETSVEDFDRMYAVTVRSAFLIAKHSIPYLLQSGNGKIINIASNFSHTALPEMIAYASSKAAIIGLTKSLALELGGEGINVNAICPGATRTEMSRPFWGTEEGSAFLQSHTPLRKRGKYVALPEDMAKLAVFLASGDSDMITGESILVDGGWNAQ